MNKELFIDCYFNDLSVPHRTAHLFSEFPHIFSRSKVEPESLKPLESDDLSEVSRVSSTDDASSFCSSGSLLTIEDSVIEDILENRPDHFPFAEIECFENTKSEWFVKSPERGIFGPYAADKMDSFFQSYKLKSEMQIRNEANEYFYPFDILIKKYARIFKEMNLGILLVQRKIADNSQKAKSSKRAKAGQPLMDLDNLINRLDRKNSKKVVNRSLPC